MEIFRGDQRDAETAVAERKAKRTKTLPTSGATVQGGTNGGLLGSAVKQQIRQKLAALAKSTRTHGSCPPLSLEVGGNTTSDRGDWKKALTSRLPHSRQQRVMTPMLFGSRFTKIP